jgi:hypothetical protein
MGWILLESANLGICGQTEGAATRVGVEDVGGRAGYPGKAGEAPTFEGG